MSASYKILIAPLDWGLGHTTRCIPLIHYFLQNGYQVVVAGEGASARLLAENFPSLSILPLRGYRIRYGSNKKTFAFRMLKQIPRIMTAIRSEHHWLLEYQRQHQFDLVISDNRYGLYHHEVPCVIMTHQLQIKSGFGKWVDSCLRRLHYRFLKRFDECWAVDEPGVQHLSGELGHPIIIPPHTKYIGLLSQFSMYGNTVDYAAKEHDFPEEKEAHILVLLSGPEPMRTQLEEIIIRQILQLPYYNFTLVAGNPLGDLPDVDLPPFIRYYTHMNAMHLQRILVHADLVICRSGYSTLMDLAVMGKRALLVPTPGQTEQEYLAEYLSGKGYFYCQSQDQLQLPEAIPVAMTTQPFPPYQKHYNYRMEEVIENFLDAYLRTVIKSEKLKMKS